MSHIQKLTAILIFSLFVLGCKSTQNRLTEAAEKTRLIYQYDSLDYSITVSTIDSKIDENGIAQCSKYSITNSSNKEYHSYGNNIKSELSRILGVSKKYIDYNLPSALDNTYLQEKVVVKEDVEKKPKQVVLNSLIDIYRLSIDTTTKLLEGLELVVLDSSKLRSNISETQKGGSLSISRTALKSSGIQLKQLCKVLDFYSEDYIWSSSEDSTYYSMQINKLTNKKRVNKDLENYGLSLRKGISKKEFLVIKQTNN